MVPARRAPVAAAPQPPPPPPTQPPVVPPAHHGSSVVYKPPAASAPRLALGQAPAEAMAAAAQRQIPIRNLAGPPPKKSNPWLRYVGTALVLIACGVGGYFGFVWFHQMQSSANEKSRAEDSKNSGESQVGHIASLNSVLDATEPGHSLGELSERRSSGPRQRRTGVGAEIPVGGAGAGAPGAMAADNSPVVPPAYTLDVAAAKIPDGRVNGTISGSNFVAEAARIDPVGSALVLRLLQGALVSPDREVLIYLHLKPGEKLGGQNLSIASDMKGSGVPQVSKRWKMTPRSAPSLKAFNTGYAMKLELGAVTNGAVAGKIFLALPDTEQTVVAGGFNANIIVPDPSVQATPTVAPTVPGGMDAASRAMYEQRYGIKR